jgi:hypothetical protein
MSGDPFFQLRMGMPWPGASDGETDLWRELETVAAAQRVDLEVHPATPPDGESVLHGPDRRTRNRSSE